MKRTARMLSWLLTLCLVVGLAPVSALAADEKKAIQLGTTAIEDPEEVIILNENNLDGNTKTYYTPNSYIYFGNDNGAPILWRVLDAQKANDGSTDGIFLLSEKLMGTGTNGGVSFQEHTHYDSDSDSYHKGTPPANDDHSSCVTANVWQGSDAQAWCTTSYGNFFTAGEKQGIVGVTKEETDASNRYQISWNPSALKGEQTGDDQNKDKLFFLSARELYDYVGNYDRASELIAEYNDSPGVWWLRSPSAIHSSYSGVVHVDGVVINGNVRYVCSARPAFNINLNSVLFTSAAEGGKISAAPGGGLPGGEAPGSLSKISTTTTNEWKLTIKDNTRASFTASLSGSSTVTPGASVSLAYSGATTGHNEYVSAILTDSSGNALYYGRLSNTNDPTAVTNPADGTVSVEIPAALAAGSYTLKVFSEQYNGDYQTDYASDFVNIPLTVTTPPVADLPQTGDDSHVALWLALMGVSCAGMMAFAAYGKKRRME